MLTNDNKYCLIHVSAAPANKKRTKAAQFFPKMTIAPDKGKPVARQGRKAVSVT